MEEFVKDLQQNSKHLNHCISGMLIAALSKYPDDIINTFKVSSNTNEEIQIKGNNRENIIIMKIRILPLPKLSCSIEPIKERTQ
jgi:hypothetical protein